MSMPQLIKNSLLAFLLYMAAFSAHADAIKMDEAITIDRIQLVTQQIKLLDNRLGQSERELGDLQQKHDEQLKGMTPGKVSKSFLDKASLDISVSRSNLDSVNIELTDTQQTIAWLEKVFRKLKTR